MNLPTGLVIHCDKCSIVIPSDAPVGPTPDCASVFRAKLCWYNESASILDRFTQAAAAWSLIHHKDLTAGHPECIEYRRQFQMERKAHFAKSAVRIAMTPEQVIVQKGRTGAWVYRE